MGRVRDAYMEKYAPVFTCTIPILWLHKVVGPIRNLGLRDASEETGYLLQLS